MNNQFLEFGARQLLQENYDKESLVVVRPRPSYPFIKSRVMLARVSLSDDVISLSSS